MSYSKMNKEVNIFDLKEVRKLCENLRCTPFHLFLAYKKVGGTYNNLKLFIDQYMFSSSRV